jgi:hypothetical protein
VGRVNPLTDAEKAKIRELHGQGLGRNAIAAQLGRSGQTISAAAAAMGLSFERGPQVAAATEAARTDAKARRAALALAFLEDAERLRKQLFEACLVHNFGGKDNTFNQVLIQQPPFRDQRDIVLAAKSAMEAALRLDDHDAGNSGQTDSLLGALFAALQAKHGTGDPDPDPAPPNGDD